MGDISDKAKIRIRLSKNKKKTSFRDYNPKVLTTAEIDKIRIKAYTSAI